MTFKDSVRVWDLPTRLFHWSLATAFLVSWISAEQDELDIHFVSGYCILALVVFRIIWGFVGSTTSRFGHFVTPPWTGLAAVGKLFSRTPERHYGHSASGGWAILLMLVLLLAQSTMGLFATDGLFSSGPLSGLLASSTAEDVTDWHEALGEALPWIIGVHVAVVLWVMAVKGEGILGAMLTGSREDLPASAADQARFVSPLRALVIAAVVAAAVTALVQLT